MVSDQVVIPRVADRGHHYISKWLPFSSLLHFSTGREFENIDVFLEQIKLSFRVIFDKCKELGFEKISPEALIRVEKSICPSF